MRLLIATALGLLALCPPSAAQPSPSERPKSPVLFRFPAPDMIPEGIAYDPVEDAYYIGSIHERRIVRVGPDLVPRDFVTAGRDGLWGVLGLRVHARQRLLYVMSGAERAAGADEGKSGFFVYELGSGKLVRKILMETRPPKHLFNDVAVSDRGDAYVTDSAAGAVWRVRPLKDAFEPLVPPGTLDYPNGIAISPDGSTLYVADEHGISLVDTASGRTRPLAHPPDVNLLGIDGLYLDGDGLVAVQNGLPVIRVVRFALTKDGDAVTSARVLESRHPLFAIPTTAAVAKGFLALLATSHLDALDAEGRIRPDSVRGDVVVLKVPLR